MVYALLANGVLLLHLGFILFVLFGGLLVARRAWLAWLHLPAAAWGIGIELTGGFCPLTPLENQLRLQAGQAGYAGDFISHYLVALIYPDILIASNPLARPVQFLLGGLALGLNLFIYARLYRRRQARKHA